MRQQGHDLELRLAGNGPSRDRLEALANELGLAAHVHFLGFLNEDAVIAELQLCDLFVLPSFVEGLPVSAMEAMAIGVPVIATNIAGTSELVEHGKTGLLIRPSDAQALADAVISMMRDYPFRLSAANLRAKKLSRNLMSKRRQQSSTAICSRAVFKIRWRGVRGSANRVIA